MPLRYTQDLSFVSYGVVDKDVYYINQKVNDLFKSIDSTLSSKTYTIPFDFYKPIEYTGNTVRIKFSKAASPQSFGYYNSTHQEFISLRLINARVLEVKQAAENTYRFAFIKDNELYVFDVKDVQSTYNSKKKRYKIKLNAQAIDRLIQLSTYGKTEDDMIKDW